jgi:arsenite-transporting ATPase
MFFYNHRPCCIQDFIEQLGELPAKLRVERIDPKVETLRYTEKILEHKGQVSRRSQKLILEDLKSPCTEELQSFTPSLKPLVWRKDNLW